MPWVRLWCQFRSAAGPSPVESTYEWWNKIESQEVMKEAAEDYGEKLFGHSERGFHYGFEEIKELPEAERIRQLMLWTARKVTAEKMIALVKTPKAKAAPVKKKPKQPRSAWTRIKGKDPV